MGVSVADLRTFGLSVLSSALTRKREKGKRSFKLLAAAQVTEGRLCSGFSALQVNRYLSAGKNRDDEPKKKPEGQQQAARP